MTAVISKPARAPGRAGALQAGRSLAIAGQVLDPNGLGGPDLPLAKLLLAHALVAVAGAIESDGTVPSTAAAIDTLEHSGVLRRASGNRSDARGILESLGSEHECPRDSQPLIDAELLLRRVVRVVRGDPAVTRTERWGRWGLALLLSAAVGVVVVVKRPRHGPWEKYRWTASSAVHGFVQSGLLGQHGSSDLVFHTDRQPQPWVLIDLLEVRTIHNVTVTNRPDCCDDRCLPLVVEVAENDGQFIEVGRQTEPFSVWPLEFRSRGARYVRLRVDATNYFHLAGVEIR